ncbi:hypothetical protein [Acinetobacter wuhouensis]|uniref:Uncharacterized protein n=1 Tax=Acinetobacter wuhouensis TaxID=1879050 RepID=A0A4V2DN69_9GAMM|nr:hypothetical protein [Acinetobacter wuhouensis]RZG47000.1 hypothetical protein EXU28_07370 [Acinetobacter wuhouensis]RZG71953.1 hypothetical protein EXU29_12590 [Acinetobacter wuhouensis]
MNKFSKFIFIIFSISTTQIYAETTFKKVSACDSDYFQGNFCSKANIAKYKQALKTMKPNFNDKYILLNTGTVNSLEMIALDTQTGIGYPLNYQFTGWEDNQGKVLKKPSATFSLTDSKLCLSGSQYDGDHPGTHETYSNIKNCFKIKKDRTYTSFESTNIDQIQYEYDQKTKTWKAFKN